jgi:hypothetical protein
MGTGENVRIMKSRWHDRQKVYDIYHRDTTGKFREIFSTNPLHALL